MTGIIKYIKRKQQVRRVRKSFRKLSKSHAKLMKARSKRVAVEFGISATRQIAGQQFRAWDFVTNRRAADRIVAEKREDDYLARVTPENRGYAIWIREKP